MSASKKLKETISAVNHPIAHATIREHYGIVSDVLNTLPLLLAVVEAAEDLPHQDQHLKIWASLAALDEALP